MSSFSSSSTKKKEVRRLLRLLLSFSSLSSISGNSLFANFVGKHSWIWVNASVALLKLLLVYFCHCSLGSQERGRHWIPRPRERGQSAEAAAAAAGLVRYYRSSLNIMQSLHYRSFVTTRGLLSRTMISWGFSASALICSWRVAVLERQSFGKTKNFLARALSLLLIEAWWLYNRSAPWEMCKSPGRATTTAAAQMRRKSMPRKQKGSKKTSQPFPCIFAFFFLLRSSDNRFIPHVVLEPKPLKHKYFLLHQITLLWCMICLLLLCRPSAS